jgi:enamine deaminase RidA (YjgF/YER057c/UK114 family)
LVLIERLNPAGMHSNPAYSQGISVPASARHIYVGGQNGVDAEGRIVGESDLTAQTIQALANLEAVLAAGGAKPSDLISLTVCLVADADLRPAFGAWAAFWNGRGLPPVVKVLRVAGLGNPDFLIEIEAMAAIVEGDPV